MSKIVTLTVYRYHLSPLTHGSQMTLFSPEQMSEKDIVGNKNIFLKKVLDDVLAKSSGNNPMNLTDHGDGFYLYKIANLKTQEIPKDFKKRKTNVEPYSFIIINNDPKVQKIAISHNPDAFSYPNVVKNILQKILRRELGKYGLNIEIESLFDKSEFWDTVKQHKHEIKRIQFEFIKPNLANISGSLDKSIKALQNKVNGHKSKLEFEAPTNGVLENINKNNKQINGLVDYSSEGGGNIKMKIKGLKKLYNTESSNVSVEINELDLEGSHDQLIKLYREIMKS